MPRRATRVVLSEKEQQALERIRKRHRSERQEVLRASIVSSLGTGRLQRADCTRTGGQCGHGALVARSVGLQGINLEILSIAERLRDVPRPGAPPRITAEQRCQIAALGCEAPSKAGRPISQWTGREIAEEVMARGDALADFAATCGLSARNMGASTTPLPLLADQGT